MPITGLASYLPAADVFIAHWLSANTALGVSGAWNAGTAQSHLSWTEITDSAVVAVEVRACEGPAYDEEDETVLASQAPSAPRAWAGDFGLGGPGAAASFKVYLLTAQGHERGSNAVTVERPA